MLYTHTHTDTRTHTDTHVHNVLTIYWVCITVYIEHATKHCTLYKYLTPLNIHTAGILYIYPSLNNMILKKALTINDLMILIDMYSTCAISINWSNIILEFIASLSINFSCCAASRKLLDLLTKRNICI